MSDAVSEIRQVIQTYLDGLYHCDTERLADVFHPQAIYASAVGGEQLIMNMATYFPVVAKRDPPARTSASRKERILIIDVVGPEIALVKLECSFFGKDYVDLLTLIRVGGKWRIIAKVFHY